MPTSTSATHAPKTAKRAAKPKTPKQDNITVAQVQAPTAPVSIWGKARALIATGMTKALAWHEAHTKAALDKLLILIAPFWRWIVRFASNFWGSFGLMIGVTTLIFIVARVVFGDTPLDLKHSYIPASSPLSHVLGVHNAGGHHG